MGLPYIAFLYFLASSCSTISVFGKNCSFRAQDAASCALGDSSREACFRSGCCWNETRASEQPGNETSGHLCYRSKHLNGTCIEYPETGICHHYLNTSALKYRNTSRYIDYKVGLNKTDYLLSQFQHLVTVIAKDTVSKTCLLKIRKILCQYILTPCSPNGTPIPMCRRDCELLEEECPDTLQKLLGAGRVSLVQANSVFDHLYLPECRNLRTQEELAAVGATCYTTGIFKDKPAATKTPIKLKSTLSIIFIAVIAASCVLVLSIILIIFVICRRRKKAKRERTDGSSFPMTVLPATPHSLPSVSVKDHIIQLTADDVLKSKMSITDMKEIKQYPIEMIAYDKDLGEGQFGQVFQGRAVGLDEEYPEEEVVVAVKTLKKGSSQESKNEFEQETLLMNFLHHPNIVQLLAVSAMEEPYCMIFEFMSKGDLSEFLRNSELKADDDSEPTDSKKTQLTEEMLIKMCVDVAKGLQFLAGNRLIHRDVATRNCLVSDDLTIKIADFGMSRDIYSSNYYKIERETLLPVRWLAPEAIMFGKFTVHSDIYSYGVLLWEVFTFSMQPYYGYTNKEVLDFIRKGVHLGQPEICPGFLYELMLACWAMEPTDRPEYKEIISKLRNHDPRYDIPDLLLSDDIQDERSLYYQNVPISNNETDALLETADTTQSPPFSPITQAPKAKPDLANNPLYNARLEEEKQEPFFKDPLYNSNF